MSDLIVKNGIVVTVDSIRRILENGAVVVENGKIVEVNRTERILEKYKAEKVIDAKGKVVLPGFICSHTHLYGTVLRGATLNIQPPTDFTQNLQRIWWPVDEALTLEDAYASALAACLDFLRTGTTLFADTYSGPNSIENSLDYIEKAVREVGIRGILAFEATERHSEEEGERGLKENIRFIEKMQRDEEKVVMGMVSLHASFTVSNELMLKGKDAADKYHVPITIHTSEGLGDVYHNLERYGKRTIERMYDLGFLDKNVVLAHCVNLVDDELKLLKEKDAKVAHNPMSNMLNAVGVAPIVKMLEMEIKIGLGNDGYIFDVFENMRSAFLLHKVHHKDPKVISPMEALEMATIRGAELYGLEKELGSLEAGKYADVIIIDARRAPTPINANSVVGHLINTFSGLDVETVIVNGKILMENRKIKVVDEQKANEKIRKQMEKLWDRIKEMKQQIDVKSL